MLIERRSLDEFLSNQKLYFYVGNLKFHKTIPNKIFK